MATAKGDPAEKWDRVKGTVPARAGEQLAAAADNKQQQPAAAGDAAAAAPAAGDDVGADDSRDALRAENAELRAHLDRLERKLAEREAADVVADPIGRDSINDRAFAAGEQPAAAAELPAAELQSATAEPEAAPTYAPMGSPLDQVEEPAPAPRRPLADGKSSQPEGGRSVVERLDALEKAVFGEGGS